MKKSELTQLVQIIEHLISKEIKKQLPILIAEVLHNTNEKFVVNEQHIPQSTTIHVEHDGVPSEEENSLKTSLRELFAGTSVMKSPDQVVTPKQRQFTKNPILNQILNETTSNLKQKEQLVGSAAYHGGYSSPDVVQRPFEESGNMQSISSMPDMGTIVNLEKQSLVESQSSNYVPSSNIPEGISALDVVKQVPLAPEVKHALTRNYSEMMKLIDKKRKGVS